MMIDYNYLFSIHRVGEVKLIVSC